MIVPIALEFYGWSRYFLDMCGRFTQIAGWQTLLNRFLIRLISSEIKEQTQPRYNLAPSQDAYVVTSKGTVESRELTEMKWGLIPAWSKNAAMQFNTINARAEGVKESPVFREPFKRSRCVVPANGFFEWQAGSSPKQPYYIYPAESGELFAFAGLWDCWTGSAGQTVNSFTILTTHANAFMQPIHQRMPVILSDEDLPLWLGEEVDAGRNLETLLKPAPDETMAKHKVSTYVNKVSHESPETILPYEPMEWDF